MNLSRRSVLSSILSVLGLPTFAKPLLGETYLPGYNTWHRARVAIWESDVHNESEWAIIRRFREADAIIREDDQGAVWWVQYGTEYIEYTPKEDLDFIIEIQHTCQAKYGSEYEP